MELDKLKIDEFPDAEGLFVYASDGVRIGRVSTIVFDEVSRESPVDRGLDRVVWQEAPLRARRGSEARRGRHRRHVHEG